MTSTFLNLGVCREILDVIEKLDWKKPSEIQVKALPHAFRGKDIIGLAETGSGKTAAFAIPILQSLIAKPRHNFALILTPTRELAMQSRAQFLQLGESYGLKVICLVGGQHTEDQAHELKSSKFHIIIGTPGRVVYHLENNKELRLDRIRYFVLDEADQMVEESFESQLKLILSKLPASRNTYLYSATLGEQTRDIQALCLRNPVTIEVSGTFSKVDKLDHAFVFLPEQERNYFLVYLLTNSVAQSATKNQSIVFTTTWRESFRIAGLLKAMMSTIGVTAVPLNGVMQQDKRQEALFQFRSGTATVLVATDLAARGLDIPGVDLVINYDVPRRPSWSDSAKAYIHRVGRTARAGRFGRAITLVTPYSAGRLKAIEAALGEPVPQLQWPGLTSMSTEQRAAVTQADNISRANLRKRDKQKRLLKKKRQMQKVRRLQSFAEPVSAASSSDEESS